MKSKAGKKKQGAGIVFLSLLIAGVLLYLAFRNVNWTELKTTIKGANPGLLGLACLLISINGLIRSLRWRVLLSAERWLGVLVVFWATMAGYLGNAFLPARAGELVRSVALGRREKISSSFVLATALTERILDAVVLVFIGTISLITLENTSPVLIQAGKTVSIISILGLVGILVLPYLQKPLMWLLKRLPIQENLTEKLKLILEQFVFGMSSLRHPPRALLFLFYTSIIWLGDAVAAIIIAKSMGLVLSIPQALLLGVALGLSSAIPSTPGYIGIYQFVAVTVLLPFDINNSQALGFILVLQALSYLMTTIFGGIGLWQLKLFNIGDLVKKGAKDQTNDELTDL